MPPPRTPVGFLLGFASSVTALEWVLPSRKVSGLALPFVGSHRPEWPRDCSIARLLLNPF